MISLDRHYICDKYKQFLCESILGLLNYICEYVRSWWSKLNYKKYQFVCIWIGRYLGSIPIECPLYAFCVFNLILPAKNHENVYYFSPNYVNKNVEIFYAQIVNLNGFSTFSNKWNFMWNVTRIMSILFELW